MDQIKIEMADRFQFFKSEFLKIDWDDHEAVEFNLFGMEKNIITFSDLSDTVKNLSLTKIDTKGVNQIADKLATRVGAMKQNRSFANWSVLLSFMSLNNFRGLDHLKEAILSKMLLAGSHAQLISLRFNLSQTFSQVFVDPKWLSMLDEEISRKG